MRRRRRRRRGRAADKEARKEGKEESTRPLLLLVYVFTCRSFVATPSSLTPFSFLFLLLFFSRQSLGPIWCLLFFFIVQGYVVDFSLFVLSSAFLLLLFSPFPSYKHT